MIFPAKATMWMCAALIFFLVEPAHLQEECEGSSCHPTLGDLMVGRAAHLSASSTCGLNRPQSYCILGYLEDDQKCFTCDSRSPYNRYNNRNSHQIENIITTFEPERKMKWWQSENGVHQVSIQLDLETVFQFSHLVMTFKSFRPAAMLVERSKDFGRTWKVLRYFSIDCASDFPRISAGPAETIDDLICDSRYSGAEPSTEGEVVLKALDPHFHIENPFDPIIQELITMTNLRVNFTRLLTLGDDLLGRKRRNPQDKYYYALYEMVVRGSCFCNGHASQCMPVYDTRGDIFNEPGMVHGQCVCQHNTMGSNCEKCKDFYNDAPWRPAGSTDPHVCRKCNCNGHSERCHFDLQRYMSTRQVSGGVCDDCRNNRMGAECELCRPHYYKDPLRSLNDPNACIPCNCNSAGSLDGGLCDPVSGQCVCKQNVEGEQCDRCKTGFYRLSQEDPGGCQRCMCNFLGTISTSPCDQNTGQCICDHFAHGPECNQCVPGYWGLGNTVYDCQPCDCDIGGAFTTLCASENGQCQCRANMVGRHCSEPAPGYFLAALDFYLYEAEKAAPLGTKCSGGPNTPTVLPLYPTTTRPSRYCPPGTIVREPTPQPYYRPEPTLPRPYDPDPPVYENNWPTVAYQTLPPAVPLPNCVDYFRSRGYDVEFRDGRFVVVKRESRRKRRQGQSTIPLQPGYLHQVILRPHTPDEPITWTGPGVVQVQDGAGLRFIVTNIPLTLNYHLVVRYESQPTDDWTAVVKIVPLGSLDENCPFDPSKKTFILASTSRTAILDPSVCLSSGVRYYVDITFENPDPYCSSHILIDSMGLIPKMESLPNFCSDASLAQYQQHRCVELGAQAGENTLPEVCEKLVASMSAYIHNGAIPCRCNPEGSFSSSCSKFTGQCDCKPNVVGRCCDTCAPLTYGFGQNGCSPCNCEPSGSKAEFCDHRTGQCQCQNGITGRRCDGCLPGYYGFPNCRPCQCNGLSDLCDQITGVCLNCRGHSTGPHCERCDEGYVGDPVLRETCQPCRCPDVKGSGRFFAHSCRKDPNSLTPTCHCRTGNQGLHCDRCAPGYYGNLLLPGSRCQECPCNNNIDPNDGEACDALTGNCLRCLHNTFGPQCQTCKPGYYGNALLQDCRVCSCDQQGTDMTKCPLGSPCICDEVTGQCPCRRGVVGIRCDRCEDGYWNLNRQSGCQPCNCHTGHSSSNLCDKVTGQCPCETGYGGKQCQECAANHFGNPDIQCISCDCDMEGSVYPGCDADTGECLCRPGVSGNFCEKCAPGYDPVFPACEPCHPCYHLWGENVTDISKAMENMQSLISKYKGSLSPSDKRHQEKIQKLNETFKSLVSMLGSDQVDLESLQNFLNRIRNLTETTDPNMIIIDPSNLLETEIDNIYHEFKKLLDDLHKKVKDTQKTDIKKLNDTLERIRKLHTDFLKDEERVKKARNKIDTSRQTRQETKKELSRCQLRPLDILEKKVKGLSVARLNEEICGAPGDAECEKAVCGGALCGKCGGPSCTGSLPIALNATDTAKKIKAGIQSLLQNLTEAETKIKGIKNTNKDVKAKAQNMMNKIIKSKSKFEKAKNDTRKLIESVREYLRDMMEPEDIDKVASAVLAINLPRSPDEIKKMIQDIQKMMENFTHITEDLKDLEDQAKLARDLKNKADEILNRTKETDVSDIEQTLKDTSQLHDKIKEKLNEAKDNKNITSALLDQSDTKLTNAEENLSTPLTTRLPEEIEALKNKTEMNRAQALEAKTVADAALSNVTDTNKDLEEIEEKLKKLKNNTQGLNDSITEHLKNITMEAKNMAKDVEDKMKQIEELEKRIQNAVRDKMNKMKELEDLLAEVTSLQKYIADKVINYTQCGT
ncbi:laminin subunit beta-4 isoform X2 [Hemibagrus wyckioides]|uniref:laminin subunit beta-4 isoform X2 n=1 Tax=Hemibagrus wyckioides TaxID=337641 RepID=UPI00266B444D|nr:laminin subunit beta-4 isoform X2 [Hemibagrus wyckioides]